MKWYFMGLAIGFVLMAIVWPMWDMAGELGGLNARLQHMAEQIDALTARAEP